MLTPLVVSHTVAPIKGHRPDRIVGFVKNHWQGKYSLGRSYWVHGFLLSITLNIGAISLQEPLEQVGIRNAVTASLGIMLLLVLVGVWQLVGIWRSASNSSQKTGRGFWPGLAKFAVILGVLALLNSLTAFSDIANVLVAINDPEMSEYEIERIEETDIVFTGAINDESVDEILLLLSDPKVEILRVNSHGGLIDPALRLARFIKRNETMVMADGQCVSACVLILAASPSAAIYPGTPVTFHRTQPVVDFQNADLRREYEIAARKGPDQYREFEIAEWAIERAESQEFWTPTMRQLIDMGILVFVYRIGRGGFVFSGTYCSENPVDCDRKPDGPNQ